MKILITGANGFLGCRLSAYYREKAEYEVAALSSRELDFTRRSCVEEWVGRNQPDIVIHCGAVSDIGACERNPQLSQRVNVKGTVYLADACRVNGCRLIVCSSDQVYCGNGVETPHREKEILKPPHLYGKQKAAAEQEAMDRCPHAVCLRLSWMYDTFLREGEEHGSLMSSIMQAARAGTPLSLPVHDYRSITDVRDVVENMQKVFTLPAGIYNYGSPNDLSTYDLVASASADIPAVRRQLRQNTEAFREQARNLRLDQEKLNAAGVYFPDGLEKIKKNLLSWN